jgi:hypothetical protein
MIHLNELGDTYVTLYILPQHKTQLPQKISVSNSLLSQFRTTFTQSHQSINNHANLTFIKKHKISSKNTTFFYSDQEAHS